MLVNTYRLVPLHMQIALSVQLEHTPTSQIHYQHVRFVLLECTIFILDIHSALFALQATMEYNMSHLAQMYWMHALIVR